ncbi:hypothetical protein I7I51_02984 [Histoplasma capsulatum]|uniref:Uncharacterized protein n=1 Tax=Ajellomyces capsulatus TaxID=5037 RepID=A0A8A1MQA0_AJECA|nr:hypothetical protein I7I51_02984 [Histoplasma capsulatum]
MRSTVKPSTTLLNRGYSKSKSLLITTKSSSRPNHDKDSQMAEVKAAFGYASMTADINKHGSLRKCAESTLPEHFIKPVLVYQKLCGVETLWVMSTHIFLLIYDS